MPRLYCHEGMRGKGLGFVLGVAYVRGDLLVSNDDFRLEKLGIVLNVVQEPQNFNPTEGLAP